MRSREMYPAGVPCWVDLTTPDPLAAAAFYRGLFGWEITPAESAETAGYSLARLGDAEVAGVQAVADPTSRWRTYVAVADVAETANDVTDAGGTVITEPMPLPGLARVAFCRDPQGAAFGLWQPAGMPGAGEVNKPATWNWSELNVPDPEPAARFYEAVFGWQCDTLDLGGEQTIMVRLPGYGAFLEIIDPGIRQRHETGGAPPNFTDAIAWLQPLGAGDDDAAYWSVTFAVADAVATADQAKPLGGQVRVPPFTAGGTVVAVLADPHGASFTISQYAGATAEE
ncbi:VOC family protein [Natronosporangium hydrolyticum]|uniref:VOC family protein n=1 Tax=Natronosporangium hydrolyticum TaxID=2811111 RepID=A0A895YAB0_9ACTN|nr:VOC family protein [Natronosporangium hydrolyticum]QSB13235.1 VOC family protein [Natronosporangium hydrolyticum]